MTTAERTTAVGVFTERSLSDRALEELRHAGFTDDQIGFVSRGDHATEDTLTGEGKGGTATGAATGAVSGGIIGGVIGAAASLLIPGLGPAIAGGVLVATFGGLAIGAVAGGFIGALTSIGVPEEEARYYQQELELGRTIVTVHAPGRYQDAVAILRASGAYDASVRDMPHIDAPASSDSVPPVLPGAAGPGMAVGGAYPSSTGGGGPIVPPLMHYDQGTANENRNATDATSANQERVGNNPNIPSGSNS